MVSGIVYVFVGFLGRDWSGAAELTYCGGPTGGIDGYRPVNCSFFILLKIGIKVSAWVRMTPVKSFLYHATHSKDMLKNPNAPYMSIIGGGALGSV